MKSSAHLQGQPFGKYVSCVSGIALVQRESCHCKGIECLLWPQCLGESQTGKVGGVKVKKKHWIINMVVLISLLVVIKHKHKILKYSGWLLSRFPLLF